MSDYIDELFAREPHASSENDEDYYPGSRRKRRDKEPDLVFEPQDWHDDYTIKTVKGVDTRLYPVGALATALGVSVSSIRRWSVLGRMPAAPYRLESTMVVNGQRVAGRRYYSKEMIDAVVEVFTAHGVLGRQRIEWTEHPDIPIEIYEKWKAIATLPPTPANPTH